MDTQLASSKRYETDKILTKTMINNYAKNDLLPPPLKKKYSRETSSGSGFYLFYFKNLLTIAGIIQSLLKPIEQDKYFHASEGLSLEDIYNEVFQLEKEQVEALKEDIINRYRISQETFGSAPQENQKFLKTFSFICLLSFDVYVKKQIIEKLIDQMEP